MININVGSKNPTKVQAAKNIFMSHSMFQDAFVQAVDVQIEEFGHPKSLGDTVHGAKDRAQKAYDSCKLSIGLEAGMYEAPETKSGYLETTVCALYDGEQYHIGLSPAFEWPLEMVKLILSGRDGSQAFKEIGLTSHKKIGTAEGGISILTHGKINRVKYNELAIMMALIHLENPEHY